MAPKKTWLSWSSGKDSAWALHVLRRDPRYKIVGLLTTLNQAAERVAMHAVRQTLLELQARAVGLPLRPIGLPSPCSNDEYQRIMGGVVQEAKTAGVECMAFGDLFLEDVRAYRESMLEGTGLEPIFPIWGHDTGELSGEMVEAGLRAHITCVDPKQLSPEFLGRTYDREFLAALPEGIDPCGERGEFHSFAYAGPMFEQPIPIVPGEHVQRDGFWFADVRPG